MKTSYSLLSVMIALSLGTQVNAAALTELDKIQVTGSRLNSDKAAANTTIISQDDIINSAAKNLPDLLNQQVGINVRSLYGNGTRSTVDMRGFGATGTQNTLILLDGRRLNDIDLSAINFAAIPVENIARIEITRGAGSVLYGDGASGGVINIITQDPTLSEDITKVSATYGSDSHLAGNVYLSHATEAFGITANINSVEDDGYRDNNDFTQTNGQLDIRVPLRSGEVYWKIGANRQDIELPGARTVDPSLSLNQLSDDRSGTSTPNDWADEDVEYTTLGYTHYLNAQDHLVLDAGYRQKTQQAQFDYGFGFGDYNDTDIETFSFTPRLLLNRTVLGRPTAYTLGLDLYSHDYASDRSNFKANIHQPIHHIDVDQDSSAAYVQAIIDATEHTQVTAGWRLQHVKQVAHDRYDATAPDAAFGSEADSFDKSDTEDSYELAVRHQIASGLSVYARHDRSVRFGTVDELFEFDSFFQQVFSPLTPQISKNYEVGGQLQFGLAEAHLAIFHQDVRNEIYFDPIAFQNVNLDDTRHDGVEISLTHHFSEAFKLTTGYTYLDVEFTDGSNEDNEVPLIPKHSYNVTADGLLFGQVNYAVSYNYVSARYFDNDASNDFGQRIPSYQTVDLKLATDIQKLNLSLLVNNLFDEKYYTYGVRSTFTAGRYNAYPIAERTVYITASYTF